MNDGQTRCGHGNIAKLIPRPDIGDGWVQAVAESCRLCEANPGSAPLAFQPGDWKEKKAKADAEAKEVAEQST
jgi:hypothetical protein